MIKYKTLNPSLDFKDTSRFLVFADFCALIWTGSSKSDVFRPTNYKTELRSLEWVKKRTPAHPNERTDVYI